MAEIFDTNIKSAPKEMKDVMAGIVIACWNGGKFFKDALLGILSQTKKPKYVVVVDDCSTDNSLELIFETLMKKIPVSNKTFINSCFIQGIEFVLLKTPKNLGPGGARNLGLKYLKNKIDIVFIHDIDDYYYPQKIEKSIKIMLKYPSCGLVYSDYDVEDMQTHQIHREYKPIYSYNHLLQECIVSSHSAISMKILDIVGLYDESFRVAEDYDLDLRIAECSAVYHIPEALYRYRLSGENLSIVTTSQNYAEYDRKVKQKAYERQNGQRKKVN